MTGVRKIGVVVIQDNKLLLVRIGDVWQLPSLRQGNWRSEERAIIGRIQREIGTPVKVIQRIGDFERGVSKRSEVSHLSVFLVTLLGPLFIRNQDIVEWRLFNPGEIRSMNLSLIEKEQVIPLLAKWRLLIEPQDK